MSPGGPPSVAIVDVCSGNLRSVERALARAGAQTTITRDPDRVRAADKLVIPGQGAFGTFARELVTRGLEAPLREAITKGTPILGICLGMQVLFESSEEQGPVAGLGVVRGRVVRFADSASYKVPHIGWNQIVAPSGRAPDPLVAGLPSGAASPYVYFDHSYYAEPADPRVVALESEHGQRFCAAIRQDNLFACQFHPEKSQGVGLALLETFVSRA